MVYVKKYDPPEINTKEILRYAGVKEITPELNKLMNECIDEVSDKFLYKVCWKEFPVSIKGDFIDFGFAKIQSKDLSINLTGCKSMILFTASVGIEIDRIIAKYTALSPAKSVFFQAIGTERVESLCNTFNSEIKNQYKLLGKKTAPRFSPGYGDLPLDFQREVFRVLDCQRKIGVVLNESLLMSPSKSVTAIIGVQGE